MAAARGRRALDSREYRCVSQEVSHRCTACAHTQHADARHEYYTGGLLCRARSVCTSRTSATSGARARSDYRRLRHRCVSNRVESTRNGKLGTLDLLNAWAREASRHLEEVSKHYKTSPPPSSTNKRRCSAAARAVSSFNDSHHRYRCATQSNGNQTQLTHRPRRTHFTLRSKVTTLRSRCRAMSNVLDARAISGMISGSRAARTEWRLEPNCYQEQPDRHARHTPLESNACKLRSEHRGTQQTR